ncbi:MAG: hypothetical protein GF416_05380 [Candidatus Altiarchaeales archaeon]|nr:hypothetical protein [Candidatus Altiarchaeales archaeon]MBD3416549.1 hypothetical protein [Candidatus Altiarchaeales archaeon]
MEYETIASEYVDYGRNKFIEVSKKRVKPDNAVFLNISKGYYLPDGERRYRGGIGFPPEEDIVNGLIEKLQAVITVDDGGPTGADEETVSEDSDQADLNEDLED